MSKDFSPSYFLKLGTESKGVTISTEKVNHRRFKAWYGIDWKVMSVVWYLLRSIRWMKKLKRKPNPIHLLWALSFLKGYQKEEEHAADVGKQEKTFRKWAWFYAEGIAKLVSRVVSFLNYYYYSYNFSYLFIIIFRKIKLQNRFKGDAGELCLLTIDGTDFRIQEPWPYVKEKNRKWYSHKFKSAGVRYEIGICIKTGDICWFHGPFPASIPDITIFRMKLKLRLKAREKVVADGGYKGDPKVSVPWDKSVGHDNRVAMCKGRGRHETINGKLKRWGCLRQLFRHDRHKHHIVFKACLTLTQLLLDYGERSFDVENYRAMGFVE